ncbi:MAG TPA: hypothetical protein VIK77_02725 [Tissierellaceae bacterium]
MTKKDVLEDTYKFYSENPDQVGYADGGCQYLTKEGNKCALGRYMVDGRHQEFNGGALSLFNFFDLKSILCEEVNHIDDVDFWIEVQSWHDKFALTKDPVYFKKRYGELLLKYGEES